VIAAHSARRRLLAAPTGLLRTRPGAAVVAVLFVLVAVCLSSTLIGARVFGSANNILTWPPFASEAPAHWQQNSNHILTDPVVNFDPHRIDTRRDLLSGILPLWNPYAAAGRPLFGSQQDAPLFPLTWLAFLLPYWFSLAWIAVGKLLLAAGGTYLFCRELRLRRGPALLAAIAFAFGTYFFDWLEHPHTNVWSMLPWMLLATRRLCTRGSVGAAALLGASTGLSWLGEHPESGAFVFVATALYGTWELTAERLRGPVEPSGRTGWTATLAGRAGLLAAGLALGFGVGAVANLPLLELTRQTAPVDRGLAPYPLRAVWAFFFPEQWGMPSKAFLTSGPAVNFNERTAYIGALPLLLACAGLWRRSHREQWFFAAAGLLLFAIIFDTPLAHFVRDLPGGKVAAIGRTLSILSLCGAVLAAYGLQRWLDGSASERRRMLWTMAALAALPVVAWVGRHADDLSHLPAAIQQLPAIRRDEVSFGVIELASVWRWVVICAIGLAALALTRRRAMAIALMIALVSADLVSLDRSYHPRIPLSQANPPVPAAIRFLQTHQGHARVVASATTMPPNVAERYGLRDARTGSDVLFTRRYLDLWTGLGGVGAGEKFFLAYSPQAQRLASLFAIRYVLIPPAERFPGWLQPALTTPGGTVGLNRTALPRAWVAYGWRPAAGRSQALAMTVAASTTQALDSPVIEGAPSPPVKDPPAAGPAQVLSDGPEGVTLRAVATRPGFLVLDDSAYPGWDASLDGRPVKWLPANENFRAVAIPAGRHVVSFRYAPRSVLIGAIITLACIVALLGLWLWGRRRARPRARPV